MANGKRGTGRAFRRGKRRCAIERVFRRQYFVWDRRSDWSNYWRSGIEVLIDVNAWECQDEQKVEVLNEAKHLADNVCFCHCFMCNGHKRVDRRLWRRKSRRVTVVEADDFGGSQLPLKIDQ